MEFLKMLLFVTIILAAFGIIMGILIGIVWLSEAYSYWFMLLMIPFIALVAMLMPDHPLIDAMKNESY